MQGTNNYHGVAFWCGIDPCVCRGKLEYDQWEKGGVPLIDGTPPFSATKLLGTGVGKGGSRGRLAETAPTSGLRGFAETLGGGTHLLVVELEQEDE